MAELLEAMLATATTEWDYWCCVNRFTLIQI
jgi:hypothetical protein